MRQVTLFFSLLIFSSSSLIFISCRKGGIMLNKEADIVTATIPDAVDLLQTEAVVKNNEVEFRLKQKPDDFDFTPEFTLSDGATIVPSSGTKLDFTNPQSYTVTSQDGVWSKTYTVKFTVDDSTSFVYSFENVVEDPNGHFQTFMDDNDPTKRDWDSGNPGFQILLSLGLGPKVPGSYPTMQTDEGYKGKGALLITRSTGALGGTFGAPLAAGNLFIGNFAEITNPPPLGTHFGQPYNTANAPVSVTGYYKYKAGADFKNNSGDSKLTKDVWNVMGLLFEKSAMNNYLDGMTFRTDPKLVAIAELDDSQWGEASDWVKFEVPFEFVNGKTFNPNQEYMFSIILTSSKEGDKFNGAVGSTLYVDEVELVTDK